MTGADGLGVSCEVVSCVGIVFNAVLQWAAWRGAPWLSERELTV